MLWEIIRFRAISCLATHQLPFYVLQDCLNGVFVRVGLNPRMIHGLRIKDGKATYVSRFVKTSRLKHKKILWRLLIYEESFTKLEFLLLDMLSNLFFDICGLSKLKQLPTEISSLNVIQEIDISRYENLKSLTDEVSQGLHSLKILNIMRCHKFNPVRKFSIFHLS
ncbi:Dixin [Trifolium repens]|nr:Dixin [Trifolium repens]